MISWSLIFLMNMNFTGKASHEKIALPWYGKFFGTDVKSVESTHNWKQSKLIFKA